MKNTNHTGISKLGTGPGRSNFSHPRPRSYTDGIRAALAAAKNVKGVSCLCGRGDVCHGDCRPSAENIISAIEKLLITDKRK